MDLFLLLEIIKDGKDPKNRTNAVQNTENNYSKIEHNNMI